MRISSVTKIASILCVVASVTTMSLLYFTKVSIHQEREAVQNQIEMGELGLEFIRASDYLTQQARNFALHGEPQYYDAYQIEMTQTRTREKVLQRLKSLRLPEDEFALMVQAKSNSDQLAKIETQAMKAVQAGEVETARELMFSKKYDQLKTRVIVPIEEFRGALENRVQTQAEAARKNASTFLTATIGMVVLFIIFTLSVFNFLFLRGISHPLIELAEVMGKITKDETAGEIPYVSRKGEIGELARAADAFKTSLVENKALAIDLKRHQEDLETIIAERTAELARQNIVLQNKTRQAEAASEAKGRFLATMSHEIRTPLNGILGMTGILRTTELSEKQMKMTDIVQSSAKVLHTVIGDILDFSKIEEGKMEIHPVPMVLTEQMDDMLNLMKPAASERKVELTFKVDDRVPDKIIQDPVRINQIVLNLVSNAVKFTENGYVRVTARPRLTQYGETHLRFEVMDSGIGIPKSKQVEIFGNFTQADSSTTRKYGGSGLGLAICRKLVDMMGGEIGVESEPGEGSVFWFEVPLRAADNSEIDLAIAV